MERLKFKKGSIEVKITYAISIVIFIALALFYTLPLFWAFINSLKTAQEFFEGEGGFSLPTTWRFRNYLRVFTEFKTQQYGYLDMLWNSVWFLCVKVFVNVASSTMLAYIIARFRFPGKEFLYAVVIFANTIPIVGSGPAAFKLMNALNFVENPKVIWLAWASGFDFAFIVLYGNFRGISPAYSESAMLDGANNLRIFFQIVLPQAMPCLIAIAITQSVSVWNDYGTVMVYLRSYPNLAYGLYLFNTGSFWIEESKPIYFAATIISCIPIIVLYACSQNILLTNMTAGGLKG